MSSSVQYHFVSQTASTFNVFVVIHLGLAIFTSIYDCDVSASLAVMGIIAVLNYNVGLLFLYLIFTPASVLVDIIRIVSVSKHYASGPTGFFAFLRVVEMLIKFVATYFGYRVYSSASEGEAAGGGGNYEQINSGPSQSGAPTVGFPSQAQEPKTNPFVPPSYTAPQMPSGPVIQSSVPPAGV